MTRLIGSKHVFCHVLKGDFALSLQMRPSPTIWGRTRMRLPRAAVGAAAGISEVVAIRMPQMVNKDPPSRDDPRRDL